MLAKRSRRPSRRGAPPRPAREDARGLRAGGSVEPDEGGPADPDGVARGQGHRGGMGQGGRQLRRRAVVEPDQRQRPLPGAAGDRLVRDERVRAVRRDPADGPDAGQEHPTGRPGAQDDVLGRSCRTSRPAPPSTARRRRRPRSSRRPSSGRAGRPLRHRRRSPARRPCRRRAPGIAGPQPSRRRGRRRGWWRPLRIRTPFHALARTRTRPSEAPSSWTVDVSAGSSTCVQGHRAGRRRAGGRGRREHRHDEQRRRHGRPAAPRAPGAAAVTGVAARIGREAANHRVSRPGGEPAAATTRRIGRRRPVYVGAPRGPMDPPIG